MISLIQTCGLAGIDGVIVQVQTDLAPGMPSFEIIGLPDAAVKEARDRCKAAINNSGYAFPPKRTIINLAPASLKKEGASYDLPMAVSVLCASGQMVVDDADRAMFVGELALDGSVRPVNGVLPMVITGYEQGIRDFYVPEANKDEAAAVEGANIYPVVNIRSLAEHFYGTKPIPAYHPDPGRMVDDMAGLAADMADVKGLSAVKRAMEIAASGGHNMLMIGAPGSGKSMLAQRMPGILPDMTFAEALETTKIHSIAGMLPERMPMIQTRPFRSPHHTVSAAALTGGGRIPRPGELSLAHNGVLFLDELAEFHRDTLEVLRQPLEDGTVTISRVNATLTYPCNIMLICSMNPCKCGYFGSKQRECTCTPNQVRQYRSRISGPLLDRIDIQVEVPSIPYYELNSGARGETSAQIRERVNRVRQIQLERYKGMKIYSNSGLTAAMLTEYCRLDEGCSRLLKDVFEKLGLSARAYSRILKVARTVADMNGHQDIQREDIAEAIQYRNLDRKYFQ